MASNKILFILLFVLLWKPLKIIWRIYTIFLLYYSIKNWTRYFLHKELIIIKPIFVFKLKFILRLCNAISIHIIKNTRNLKDIKLLFFFNIVFVLFLNCTIVFLNIYVKFICNVSNASIWNKHKSIYININNWSNAFIQNIFLTLYNKYNYLENK